MDAWNGGGVTSGSVGVISGIVNLDGSANQSADSSGAATAGRYSKFNVSVNRLQSLDADLSAYVSLNVQQASKNLDSSERMYFVGASGVRAYPTSEGGGSQGQMLSVELRQRLDSQFSLTGFYDRGHVQAFKENAYANGSGSLNSGSAPNNFNLSGYGASITWQPQAGMELRATWSQRVGTNPLANTTTGADTDGTRRLNRMWVNATVNF
jgi:hemolysin activation/secretion protein